MNAAEHYAEAERLLQKWHDYHHSGNARYAGTPVWLPAAQVHATLALAAATSPGVVQVEPFPSFTTPNPSKEQGQ